MVRVYRDKGVGSEKYVVRDRELGSGDAFIPMVMNIPCHIRTLAGEDRLGSDRCDSGSRWYRR